MTFSGDSGKRSRGVLDSPVLIMKVLTVTVNLIRIDLKIFFFYRYKTFVHKMSLLLEVGTGTPSGSGGYFTYLSLSSFLLDY